MRDTNAWWVDKANQPSAIAKLLNCLLTAGVKIYEYCQSIRKTKRNST